MIRPVAMRIREFRGWRDSGRIPVDRPLTLVVGENGRGKSSTLVAAEWCFFGREIEKAGATHIEERAEWEARRRQAGRGPTEVEILLAAPEGEVAVTRRRHAGAAARTPDDLEVRLPGDRLLLGTDAQAWIDRRLPDLETFRRAHALHPESVRRRAVVTADRSAVLASLLGLDEDREIRARLAEARGGDLVQEVDKRFRAFEDALVAATNRPLRERDDAERRLAGLGVPREELGPALALRLRRGLVARAADLAARLGLSARLPDPEDAAGVAAWAPTWSAIARGPAPALAGLAARRAARNELQAGLVGIAPLESGLAERRARYQEGVRAGGDRAARTAARDAAKAAWSAADARWKEGDRLAALLVEARAVVQARSDDACPVCGTSVPSLADRLAAAVARQQGEESRRLAAEREAARAACDVAVRALDEIAELEKRGVAAREALETARKDLARHLPPASLAEGADLAAAARARVETLDREIEALEQTAGARDASLQAHVRDAEVLREVEGWSRGVERVQHGVDVASCPSWPRLDRAADALAALAADLDALAGMAKEAQADRSHRRVSEANAALQAYYADVLGDGASRGLAVDVHETGKGLEYRLLDRDGAPAVPVLNQAAINALSLALLFAQAEARARQDGLAWVLLDDPAQSLDDRRQEGLARAVERLAAVCAVTVGSTQGPFVARVESHVALPRRILRLGPRDPERGAVVEEVDER